MARWHQGRPIETLEDVRGLIASGYGSVTELLECIRVARQGGDPKLAEQAGTLLLTIATGKKPVPALEEAAQAIVVGYLAEASKLDDLVVQLERASEALGEIGERTGITPAGRKAIDDSKLWLEELRVLSNDNSPASLIALCGKLRKIDRSDLGVEAATAALERQESAAAYTTRAAAFQDRNDNPRALSDVRRAWKLDKNAFTANTFSRVLLAAGRPDLAIEKAEDAFRMEPSEYSARSLLAAAAAVGEDDAVERAKRFIEKHKDGEDPRTSVWVEIVAVKALLEADRLDEAERAIALLKQDERAPKREVDHLIGWLKRNRRRRQGGLGL